MASGETYRVQMSKMSRGSRPQPKRRANAQIGWATIELALNPLHLLIGSE